MSIHAGVARSSAIVALLVVTGGACGGAPEIEVPGGAALPESATATRIVDGVRARFGIELAEGAPEMAPGVAGARLPALGPSEVERVERSGAELWPRLAERGAPATAVRLPDRAGGALRLRNGRSSMAIDVSMDGAADVPAEVASGLVVYPSALRGAHLIHRVTAQGDEDFALFETAPESPELRYTVALREGVAGLRLVESTLEMLDAEGVPRLRVAPPYAVDPAGRRIAATLAVEGCAVDTSPVVPWGRPVTPPGERACTVRVAWPGDVAYPLLVDPVWSGTGAMVTARYVHTATVLPSGDVLVAGGFGTTALATAEVYRPASNAWSATGSMNDSRYYHTSALIPNQLVLVAGGVGGTCGVCSAAEKYDPSAGTWKPASPMITPRYHHAMSVLATGDLLATGGQTTGSAVTALAEVYSYAVDTWTHTVTPMTEPRTMHTSTTLSDGTVIIAAGFDTTGTDTAEKYTGGSFVPIPPMTIGRYGHVATALTGVFADYVLVAGGSDKGGTCLSTAERRNPSTNLWGPGGAMSSTRCNHAGAMLSNGTFMVTGGRSATGTVLASVDVYSPSANTWASSTAMEHARAYHTETGILSNLVILVAGGRNTAPLNSGEVWH